jgi:hypothetical protein
VIPEDTAPVPGPDWRDRGSVRPAAPRHDEGDRVSAIDAYVRDLDSALQGPRHAKADLVTEARDALVDATEAYEDDGLARPEAERRAVDDFGAVAQVAPAYQTELGLARSRRTGVLLFCVLVAQAFVWDHAWPAVSPGDGGPPDGAYATLDRAMETLGGLVLGAAVLAVAACGVGVRYLGARPGVVRAVGRLALGACGVFVTGSLLLATGPADDPAPLALRLAWVGTFVVLPLLGVTVSARRCVREA